MCIRDSSKGNYCFKDLNLFNVSSYCVRNLHLMEKRKSHETVTPAVQTVMNDFNKLQKKEELRQIIE